MSARRPGVARLVTSVLGVLGGTTVTMIAARMAHWDGDAPVYVAHGLGPLLAGVVLARHAALRSRREALVVGMFAMSLVAGLTFALAGGFGGVVAESSTPLAVLGLLVLACAVGTTIGVELGRRIALARTNIATTIALAMFVGTGATGLAQVIYRGLMWNPYASIYEWIAVQGAAIVVAGFFSQAVVPVCRRTACAVGLLILPLVDIAYVFLFVAGELTLEWDFAAWFGGAFVAGWLGAHAGWHAVGRYLHDDDDALVAVFE